jgi:hypothetical protein
VTGNNLIQVKKDEEGEETVELKPAVRDFCHYVIKFVSDLRQVGCFLWVLRFLPPIKLTATLQLKYC